VTSRRMDELNRVCAELDRQRPKDVTGDERSCLMCGREALPSQRQCAWCGGFLLAETRIPNNTDRGVLPR